MIGYLTAWPDQEKEPLRYLCGNQAFPSEVINHLRRTSAPLRLLLDNPNPSELVDWFPDDKRLSAFSKDEFHRHMAWELTLAYGHSVGIDNRTWRKAHTEFYWAWHVPEPGVHAL